MDIVKTTRFSLNLHCHRLPDIDCGDRFLSDENPLLPPELISGVLHQGTKAVMAGGSKIGKTWILLDMALSVATGTNFLNWTTQQGRVLFINYELKKEFILERINYMKKTRNIQNTSNLDVWNLRGQAGDFGNLVSKLIHTAPNTYSLIIIDPIYKAMVGKSENTAGSVSEMCRQLELLAERTGAAIVFAHHFTKGNSKKKAMIDRMSGSGVFARDADTILSLTPHSEPNCFTVEMILRNLAPQNSFVVEWKHPVMVLRNDLAAETEFEEEEEFDDKGVLGILENNPMTTTEWQKLALDFGISRPTFYRIIFVLKEQGKIKCDSKTKQWSVVEEAETGETSETGQEAGSDVARTE